MHQARLGESTPLPARLGERWRAGGGAQRGAAVRPARLSFVGLLRGRAGLCLLALLVPLVNGGELPAAVGTRSLRLLARLAVALALATARDAKPGRKGTLSA